jgi:hypothetical protein
VNGKNNAEGKEAEAYPTLLALPGLPSGNKHVQKSARTIIKNWFIM